MDWAKLRDSKNAIIILEQTPQLIALMTIIRDKDTSRREFKEKFTRIGRMVIEYGMNLLPTEEYTITTPTGSEFTGLRWTGKICGAVILRAALAISDALIEVCPDIRMCHLLIQRNEKTAEPIHMYTKTPADIADRWVLLCDPMLATGGSAITAINELCKLGVLPERIIFFNIICAPDGINAVHAKYPEVKIVTATIDEKLNEKSYIIPGLGDAGDRYFGT